MYSANNQSKTVGVKHPLGALAPLILR